MSSFFTQYLNKLKSKDTWSWLWSNTKSGANWFGNMTWILGTATLFISIPLQFANDREKFGLYYMLAVAFYNPQEELGKPRDLSSAQFPLGGGLSGL
jgi:hypothetical protein